MTIQWRADLPELYPHLGRGGFSIMVRSPDDPDRAPRTSRPGRGGTLSEEARALKRSRAVADYVGPVIKLVYASEKPLTFNAIGVLLLDKTADILAGTVVEAALWQAVAQRAVKWGDDNGCMVFAPWRNGEPLHDGCGECLDVRKHPAVLRVVVP